MTVFECVKRYIGGFDPQFPQSVEGASPRDVQELERLAGGMLPSIYKDFLQVMGRNTDWLSVSDFDLRIDGVIRFYRDNQWLTSTRYVRIGNGTRNPLFHPYLEVVPLAEGDPPVVCLPECNKASYQDALRHRTPVAGSLEEMICTPVFDMFELRGGNRQPVCITAEKWDPPAIDRASAFYEEQGFERLWFSSDDVRAFRREDAAVRIAQFGGAPMQVWIGADLENDQAFLADLFLRRVQKMGT
jgi:hypothetical protein